MAETWRSKNSVCVAVSSKMCTESCKMWSAGSDFDSSFDMTNAIANLPEVTNLECQVCAGRQKGQERH